MLLLFCSSQMQLHFNYTGERHAKVKVVVLFDSYQPTEPCQEKISPVSYQNNHLFSLDANRLTLIDHWRRLNNLVNVSETADLSLTEAPLVAIGGNVVKTTTMEEMVFLWCVKSCQHSLHHILHHCVILILPHAVVSMQRDNGLS